MRRWAGLGIYGSLHSSLDDFNFYWHHRLSHNIRPTVGLLISLTIMLITLTWVSPYVSGWFITFYKPIFWLWMPLVGFEPVMVGTALIINAAYQFFLHSQLVPSLGWYEKVFNTPYIHQVHHSSNVEYLDRNHGGMLIIWDKIFGTYQPVMKDVKFKFGVVHGPKTKSPIEANTHEFKSIWEDMKKSPRLIDKLRYIFDAPGMES